MKKGTQFAVCGLAFFCAWAHAEDQPVYDADTGKLSIPSATGQGQPGYFQDILLEPVDNVLWQVGQLSEGVLLEEKYVDEIWTTSTRGLPHQFFIHVEGAFLNGCPSVGRVEQKREGNVFEVFVYYGNTAWLRDPSVLCTMAVEPFELTIPLNVYGLEAGEYSVRVNDFALRTFVLEQDNVGPDQFGGERRPHCQYEPRQEGGWMAYSCSDGSSTTLQ